MESFNEPFKHSKKLGETAIWIHYKALTESDEFLSRRLWVMNVYNQAVKRLSRVVETFPNYTLHDETHVINVLDAMGGVLGDSVNNLSVGDSELLILAASLHDIGMVYDEDERNQALSDARATDDYLRKRQPDLVGCNLLTYPDEAIKQDYLRYIHPFRINDVLDKHFDELISSRDKLVVTKETIVAVCQSHGEDIEDIRRNKHIKYDRARDIDPMFCSALLRLADLLDFDDTRAPRTLFGYALCNNTSKTEWEKHMQSAGFNYSGMPSDTELPYIAECESPSIEFVVREFISWIDIELNNCRILQKDFNSDWKSALPFPSRISQDNITSKGYKSGNFSVELDQKPVLELLTGENLYDRKDVFVRELLQNAVDATLLMSEMDNQFSYEESPINIWDWRDEENNHWFRIDDCGTGMTLGMIKRYFLKVGKSYYTSDEMKRDLSSNKVKTNFKGISQFGIGFLSCFICGTYADISTLYYDVDKNIRETEYCSKATPKFGIRMEKDVNERFYTVRSEIDGHDVKPMVSHPLNEDKEKYRTKHGTSILIKLDDTKLAGVNLRETVDEYVMGTRMPVFFNGEKVSQTLQEIELKVKQNESFFFEMSEVEKNAYDRNFSNPLKIYPRFRYLHNSISQEMENGIQNCTVIYNQGSVEFDDKKEVDPSKVEALNASIYDNREVVLRRESDYIIDFERTDWDFLISLYGDEKCKLLKEYFSTCKSCPSSTEVQEATGFFGEVKTETLWELYEKKHLKRACCSVGVPEKLRKYQGKNTIKIYYNGILQKETEEHSPDSCYLHCSGDARVFAIGYQGFIFLEKDMRTETNVSRTDISQIPFEPMLALSYLIEFSNKSYPTYVWGRFENTLRGEDVLLSQYRKIRTTPFGKYLTKKTQGAMNSIIGVLSRSETKRDKISVFGAHARSECKNVLLFIAATIQDSYSMKIDFDGGQIIHFDEKDNNGVHDAFPPLMFCESETEDSRRFICEADEERRRCINQDHRFVRSMLKYVDILKKRYASALDDIVNALYDGTYDDIISSIDVLQEAIKAGCCETLFDVDLLKKVTKEDFYFSPYDSEKGIDGVEQRILFNEIHII
ncbi:MAG: hypothetical protein K6G47_05980 [Clostridia bacterium]|nr:hypothetical protein [Clostridia bacterium]